MYRKNFNNNNMRGTNKYRRGRNFRQRGRRNQNNDEKLVMRDIPKYVIDSIIRDNMRNRSNWRNNNNNNNRKKLNKLDKKMTKISKEIVNSSVPNTNLVNKNNKKRKEARRDKIKSPMSMVLSGQFIPINRISERCLINYTYTKMVLKVPYGGEKTSLLLFPYSINFKPESFNQIDEKITVAQNKVCNIFYNVLQANMGQNPTYYAHSTTPTGIIGNWKLIGTSYKLYNTTSRLNIGGNIVVTKLIDNIMNPIFTSNELGVPADIGDYLNPYLIKNYELVQPKNSFGPTDVVRIDEYNTGSGTNIFQGPTEYLGCKFESNIERGYPNFPNDPVGNNTKYLVEIYATTNQQTYMLEIWNVFAIIPAPSSGLSNVVKQYDYCFDESVVEEMKTKIPMYSTRKV